MFPRATLVFDLFSSGCSNFRQGHGSSVFFSPATDSLFGASSFSFSKATDCTSAALRGGREADSGIEEDREMIDNESSRDDIRC